MKRLLFLALTLAAASSFLGGCASRPEPERSAAMAEARMERMLNAPPVLRGSDVYFGARVRATVSISTGFGPGRGEEGSGPGGKERGRHGGGGGMGGGGGRHRQHDEGGESSEAPQMHIAESSMPPVMLHIELENLSDKPVKLLIWEFNSELGNFAVRPDTLNLAPGEKGHPDGMTSRLGLTSSALPVTLTLRLEGKEERKIITVTPVEHPTTKDGGGESSQK